MGTIFKLRKEIKQMKKKLLNLQMFAMISHDDAAALIPEEEFKEVFKNVAQQSQVFKLGTRLPNMSSNKERIKVEDVLPIVYWQSAPTALKKTGRMAWKDKFIYAEELAVIIPIAEADLDDAEFDIWAQARPKIEEAIAKKIDQAVLFGGDDKPSSFPDAVFSQAFSHGYIHNQGGSETIYNAISEAMGLVEDAGYEVNGLLGGTGIKKIFRGMVDTTGQLITGDEISALPRALVGNGAWDKSKAHAIVGDFKQIVFSVRQDVKYKLLTEGIIQDPSDNSIVYNLGQQDMVALRVTFRFGWQLPNPVTAVAEDEEGRLPFAVVAPTSAVKATVAIKPAEATTFTGTQEVTISSGVHGATIYYTDDGNAPTTASTKYTGKITLSASKTIKAIAVKDGYVNSDVASVAFTKSGS